MFGVYDSSPMFGAIRAGARRVEEQEDARDNARLRREAREAREAAARASAMKGKGPFRVPGQRVEDEVEEWCNADCCRGKSITVDLCDARALSRIKSQATYGQATLRWFTLG